MSVQPSGDATEAELAILQALWDGGPETIRKLAERVYGAGGVSAYATVQKLLERLETKGFVRRDRTSHVHTFGATIGRDELIHRRLAGGRRHALRRVIDAVVDDVGARRSALESGAQGTAHSDRRP